MLIFSTAGANVALRKAPTVSFSLTANTSNGYVIVFPSLFREAGRSSAVITFKQGDGEIELAWNALQKNNGKGLEAQKERPRRCLSQPLHGTPHHRRNSGREP
jgi:hypothetical protein